MKGAVCYEFGKPLVIEELDIEPPRADEVKVKLAACAICHSDIHHAEGAWGGDLPAVFGHEAAGIVEEVGAGVSHVAPGDHVVVTLIQSCGQCYFCRRGEPQVCSGFPIEDRVRLRTRDGQAVRQAMGTAAFAEHVVVHGSQMVSVPQEISFESASLLACGVITGLGAVVNTAAVPAGESVVVIGTGGVGLNSIQGAVLSDARAVIAIDISEEKLEAAKAFGATHTVNANHAEVRDTVFSLTGENGADYVFVTVGSGPAVEQGMRLMRRGGTLVMVGMPATGVTTEIEITEFANDSQRILGSKMGSTRLRTDIPKLIEHYQHGRLKLDELVTGRYPLEQINEAIASVTRNEALRNVIVFEQPGVGTSGPRAFAGERH